MHQCGWFARHQLQTSADWELLSGRAGWEGISFSLPAAAGSLRLCLWHQTSACPKHNGEAGMEDMSTSLPPPSADITSADLGEMASQYVCDSRIWGLLEGLYLTTFCHADLELGKVHKITHLPMPSRKRQTPSAVTNSPSHQREDLAAYMLSFWKGDPAHPVLCLWESKVQTPGTGRGRAPRYHCLRGQKALHTWKQRGLEQRTSWG